MTPPHDQAAAVDAYYGRATNLESRIFDALTAAGKNPDHPTIADLAPVDQFHSGGIDASRALATLAAITTGSQVLDVGGGLGGPARLLAQEFGASVTVLDLTEAFVTTGKSLTARTGLSDSVTLRLGDALAMPFPDASFDVAWTQHATMNIADKERLYAEIHRAIRPGGRLAFHEIMAGSAGPIHFPVPWAGDPSISFLRPPQDIHDLLTTLGFVPIAWNDVTADALAGFQANMERAAAATEPKPLGLHVVLGADFAPRFGNLARNLAEDRVTIIQAVFDRS